MPQVWNLPVIGSGLPDVANALMQKRQQEQQQQHQNALLEMSQQQAGRQNALFDQGQEDRKTQQQQQRYDLLVNAAETLAGAANDPMTFDGVKARIINDPRIAPILAESNIRPEQITPQAVNQFLLEARAMSGTPPPQQPAMPEDFRKWQLGQQFPGYGEHLVQQNAPKPSQSVTAVVGPDGNPIYVPTSEAAGRTPYVAGPKPSAGYRLKSDGSGEFEPIPGGAVDAKNKAQKVKEVSAKKSVAKMVNAEIRNIDLLIGSEDGKIPKHPGFNAATGSIQGRLPSVFQSTVDADELFNSLKSKASISALKEIRSGGSQSIGTITEREWPRLEGMKVALAQSQGKVQLLDQLKEYRAELRMLKQEAESAPIDESPTAPGPAAQSGAVLSFDANGDPL